MYLYTHKCIASTRPLSNNNNNVTVYCPRGKNTVCTHVYTTPVTRAQTVP